MAQSTVGSNGAKVILLTGPPGIGKTTLVKAVCDQLRSKAPDVKVRGFYTEELRQGRERLGFDIVTLDGRRAPLARLRPEGDMMPGSSNRGPIVGKYQVKLRDFETLSIPEITLQKSLISSTIFVVDEIGKMELFSNSFKVAVETLLRTPSARVIATIPISRPGNQAQQNKQMKFIDDIRTLKYCHGELITVDSRNRNSLQITVFDKILEAD